MKTKLIKTASGMEVEQDGKSYPVRSEDEWIEFAPFGFDVFEVKIPSERVRIVETEQQIKYTNGEYSRSSQMIKYATLLTEDKEGEGAYIYLVYDSDRSSVLSAHLTEESANKQSLELRKGFAPSVTYDIQKVEILK